MTTTTPALAAAKQTQRAALRPRRSAPPLVYSAVPTPFTADGAFDPDSFRTLLEKNVADGLHGFFLAGNMGEWSQYGPEVKRELVLHARAVAGGRAEILAGVTETGLAKTLATLAAVADAGADAYVVMLPPPAMSRRDPPRYLQAVLDAADRPVFYYHCPPANGIHFTPADFARLLAHPRLRGIKNSAGDVGVRRELLLLKKDFDFLLLEGHEWAIDEAVALGCDGVLCGLASLAGRLMLSVAATAADDWPRAMAGQEKLIRIFHGIYGPETRQVQSGLKYALLRLGLIASDRCRLQDADELGPDDRRRIDACLARYRDEW